jgi:hypothetical protein
MKLGKTNQIKKLAKDKAQKRCSAGFLNKLDQDIEASVLKACARQSKMTLKAENLDA